MIMKKLFIIAISNNSPESMTYQKRYLEKKSGEKCIEKWKRYYKENKKRLQKLFVVNTRNYLKKRKIKKEWYGRSWYQNVWRKNNKNKKSLEKPQTKYDKQKKDKQKKKDCIKDYRKNQSNNLLQKK